MTAISKNLCIDKLDSIVDKYSNAYHQTVKMKPIAVYSSTYTVFVVETNDKDSKFKLGSCVRIWKYKSIFEKGCTSNLPKKF